MGSSGSSSGSSGEDGGAGGGASGDASAASIFAPGEGGEGGATVEPNSLKGTLFFGSVLATNGSATGAIRLSVTDVEQA